jgi:hypothetical protein
MQDHCDKQLKGLTFNICSYNIFNITYICYLSSFTRIYLHSRLKLCFTYICISSTLETTLGA